MMNKARSVEAANNATSTSHWLQSLTRPCVHGKTRRTETIIIAFEREREKRRRRRKKKKKRWPTM